MNDEPDVKLEIVTEEPHKMPAYMALLEEIRGLWGINYPLRARAAVDPADYAIATLCRVMEHIIIPRKDRAIVVSALGAFCTNESTFGVGHQRRVSKRARVVLELLEHLAKEK